MSKKGHSEEQIVKATAVPQPLTKKQYTRVAIKDRRELFMRRFRCVLCTPLILH